MSESHDDLRRPRHQPAEQHQGHADLPARESETESTRAILLGVIRSHRALLHGAELGEAIAELHRACKRAVGADSGYVALLADDGATTEIVYLDPGQAPCAVKEDGPMPLRGLRAEACRTRRPVWENDFPRGESARLLPPGHVGLRNVLFAPLLAEDRALGLLGLANKPGDFTEDDALLAEAFAEVAAAAVEHRRARGTLELSELSFRSVAATAGDAIISSDDTGRVVFWNHGAARVFQYEAKEIVGRSLTLIIPEEFREAHQRGMRAAASASHVTSASTHDFVGQRKDGSRFPLEISLASWTAGKKRYFTAIGRDVSERKRAETEVEKGRSLLQAIIDNTSAIVYAKDPEGRYLFVNRRCADLFRLDAAAVVGKTDHDLFLTELADSYRSNDARVLATGSAIEVEETALLDDGQHTYVSLKFPLKDSAGVPFAVCGISTDITGRLRAEESRRGLEEQLLQAQKMEAIGSLAGGIAHDFNNLLCVIQSYTSFLKDEIKPADPMLADVEEIEAAAARAASLTRQLLTFSRRQVTDPQLVDIATAVAGIEKMLARLIGEQVQLVARVAPGAGSVMIDPGYLDQLLVNLAVNARDAMPAGGTLTIEATPVEVGDEAARVPPGEAAGPLVRLSATDTGTGMSPEVKARLFEPFFTTKEAGRGTGLGLATVYGIVQQAGGRIEVNSELGQGARFDIYLPRLASEAIGKFQQGEVSHADRPARKLTVLVAEDDERVRKAACRALEAGGFAVIEARDAREALRCADESKEEIHLLLTDLIMPGMGGRQLAEEFGARRPGSRVLFMSGYTEDVASFQEIAARGEMYLPKPFTPSQLLAKLRAMKVGTEAH